MLPRPLAHKRVVVTRPEGQAASLCALLSDAGAVPIRFPVIRLLPTANTGLLQEAVSHLEDYDWVVFTSTNGVRFAFESMQGPWPATAKTAVIGPATGRALQRRGVRVDYMPTEYRAERIADGIAGRRILLLRAQGARPALRHILQSRGVQVREVAAYRTTANRPSPSAWDAVAAGVDVITFTSASTAGSYATLQGTDAGGAVVACIGPVTADAATTLGFAVKVVAEQYTTVGLVDALKRYYGPTAY